MITSRSLVEGSPRKYTVTNLNKVLLSRQTNRYYEVLHTPTKKTKQKKKHHQLLLRD